MLEKKAYRKKTSHYLYVRTVSNEQVNSHSYGLVILCVGWFVLGGTQLDSKDKLVVVPKE